MSVQRAIFCTRCSALQRVFGPIPPGGNLAGSRGRRGVVPKKQARFDHEHAKNSCNAVQRGATCSQRCTLQAQGEVHLIPGVKNPLLRGFYPGSCALLEQGVCVELSAPPEGFWGISWSNTAPAGKDLPHDTRLCAESLADLLVDLGHASSHEQQPPGEDAHAGHLGVGQLAGPPSRGNGLPRQDGFHPPAFAVALAGGGLDLPLSLALRFLYLLWLVRRPAEPGALEPIGVLALRVHRIRERAGGVEGRNPERLCLQTAGVPARHGPGVELRGPAVATGVIDQAEVGVPTAIDEDSGVWHFRFALGVLTGLYAKRTPSCGANVS